MTVSILGREYVIEERTSETDSLLEDMNGYCDPTIALIGFMLHRFPSLVKEKQRIGN